MNYGRKLPEVRRKVSAPLNIILKWNGNLKSGADKSEAVFSSDQPREHKC